MRGERGGGGEEGERGRGEETVGRVNGGEDFNFHSHVRGWS